MRYLARPALAVLTGLVASLVTFTAAPAAVAPLPKIQPNQFGWSGMVRRPGVIRLHMSGGPNAYNLRWSRWTASSGKATGEIELYWCTPIASCHPSVHNGIVWANTPRSHRGQAFPHFTRMTWQYVNRNGRVKRLFYRFGVNPGGSVPFWTGSLDGA
jgi:hypothetical protein